MKFLLALVANPVDEDNNEGNQERANKDLGGIGLSVPVLTMTTIALNTITTIIIVAVTVSLLDDLWVQSPQKNERQNGGDNKHREVRTPSTEHRLILRRQVIESTGSGSHCSN
jgi:hypothetical protein